MKERPILFNRAMVSAILEGSKTQTRRLMKPQPEPIEEGSSDFWWPCLAGGSMVELRYCNGLSPYGSIGDRLWVRETWGRCEGKIYYPADQGTENLDGADLLDDFRWHPSIHMPRWASRITLEITKIGIEKIQDGGDREFWGEDVWKANPWVWVIEFKQVTAESSAPTHPEEQ